MIDELEWVRSARPQVEAPTPEARRRARHALDEAIGKAGRRRRRPSRVAWLKPGNLAAGAAILVVVAVVGVFLGARTRRPSSAAVQGGPELVFRAESAPRNRGVSSETVAQAASLLQSLIGALPGDPGRTSVTATGDHVIVHLSRDTGSEKLTLLSLAAVTGRLAIYDWEANVLTVNGTSGASGLTAQAADALALSQGDGSSAPGSPGAGSMALYPAVRLAANQPANRSAGIGRAQAEYFAFGNPGSFACQAAARYYDAGLARGTRCYLAGPAPSRDQLTALLPPGVSPAVAETMVVPAGTVVLQAVPGAGFARGPTFADPTAQFFVLRDRPGIRGASVINPTVGTDAAGRPDVTVGFTSAGATAFSRLTANLAHRGDLVSSLGQTLDQHFAVSLGDQLVVVPSIDFKAYPDGVPGHARVDIEGGFTHRSAQTALLEARLGSLPVVLRLTGTP